MQGQGKVSHRTFGLQKSRERSPLAPVSLTHPTPQASQGCIKGLLLGCVFCRISVFVWFGEVGEVFLKQKGNKVKENRISLPVERAKASFFPVKSSHEQLGISIFRMNQRR